MEFEWDITKEAENLKKHGIAFTEAVECFSDPKGLQLIDKKHSDVEKRWYWIGKSKTGRILTTRFTQRGMKIRIIGCADWRKFRRLYETTEIK